MLYELPLNLPEPISYSTEAIVNDANTRKQIRVIKEKIKTLKSKSAIRRNERKIDSLLETISTPVPIQEAYFLEQVGDFLQAYEEARDEAKDRLTNHLQYFGDSTSFSYPSFIAANYTFQQVSIYVRDLSSLQSFYDSLVSLLKELVRQQIRYYPEHSTSATQRAISGAQAEARSRLIDSTYDELQYVAHMIEQATAYNQLQVALALEEEEE